MILRLVIGTMLAMALAVPAPAQQGRRGGLRGPQARAVKPRPPNILERLEAMPPAQRRRFLESLPPARRQRLQQRLDQYDRLPPEERRRLREELDAFRRLPPGRQQATRELFREFNQLPENRRRMIGQEIRKLLRMNDPERRARMESEAFRSLYSPEERKILERRLALMQAP